MKDLDNLTHFPEKTDILETHEAIKPYINFTPVFTSRSINEMLDVNIFFKCENFQRVGAFKFRGACNAILRVPDSAQQCGVATHSSGNHAQALALAAKMQNLKAYIVMPSDSIPIKIKAVQSYGAETILCEPTLESRETMLQDVVNKTNAFFIHPYNNYNIIAGQATAALELLSQAPELDYIIAPVGGGGLLSGTALSAHYFSSKTKVIGAEPKITNDAYNSFKEKKLIPVINISTIADGLRTSLGEKTFNIIIKHVNDIITVTEEDIVEAMQLIWQRMKIIVEPSAAVSLAVVMKNATLFKNRKTGIILSGGNVDFNSVLQLFKEQK